MERHLCSKKIVASLCSAPPGLRAGHGTAQVGPPRLATPCTRQTLKTKKSHSQKIVSGRYSSVGMTRFELATPCTPCKCATGLRYIPLYSGAKIEILNIFQYKPTLFLYFDYPAQFSRSKLLYWIASARYSILISSLPDKSAIVLETLRIRS